MCNMFISLSYAIHPDARMHEHTDLIKILTPKSGAITFGPPYFLVR